MIQEPRDPVQLRKSTSQQALLIQAHMMHLFYGGFNFINTSSIGTGVGNFVHDRSLFLQIWTWASNQGNNVLEWLKQPHVLVLITVWWITFTVVLLLLFAVGFNPSGIGAGTLAAGFQSYAYGGFTPAGGIFATLTSMAMLGFLSPLEVGLAAVSATAVTMTVWACGVGR
ncbi:MAG: ifi-6-16 domain-containing [Lasallia pustulata]|uniref:Ifi-6-16 domain-containing n=1 Tax=Lasallia pustulata TaxID=136370 RepID=A0A5M8PJX8_9LECA|nr:MAG: ifi-6-16 domain-containing [Lasallia pustulata]